MDRTQTRIVNRLEEIRRVAAMVERFGQEHRVPAQVVNDVNVALDEVLSNIVSYAYDSGARSEILVRLAYRPSEMHVDVEDAGRPFDPLQAPPPDLGASLQARPVGGLGIHVIKSLMDEVVYARVDGKNRLHLRKKLPASDGNR